MSVIIWIKLNSTKFDYFQLFFFLFVNIFSFINSRKWNLIYSHFFSFFLLTIYKHILVFHIDSIFPSCKTFTRLCVESPFFVRTLLICSYLLAQWMDILFLPHISRNADTSTCSRWSRVSLLVLLVLWSYWLSMSAVTEIVWVCSMSVTKFAIKNAVSHLSVSAKVSAARVDLVTCFSLVKFEAIDAELENFFHKNTMYPPWLPPSGKLLKLASE